MTTFDIAVPAIALVCAVAGAVYWKWAGDRLEARLADRKRRETARK